MVTQPAYLKNLKEYARSRYSEDGDQTEFVQRFPNESDRGAIILAATSIEDSLEDKILTKLPGIAEDEDTRKRMFGQDGQLATFSKKIEMAYAMGIIDSDYRKKIDLIREIRNACAHSRKPLSFKTEVLRAPCEAVMDDMMRDLIDHEPITLRNAFITKCMLIVIYVASGEKIEGREAQLKHWAKLVKAAKKSST
jgi:hypothetical protein